MLGIREYVEIFHLRFLLHLGRAADVAACVLKGGCNLRFFLNSPRYSEDIDLDVRGVDVDEMRTRVNALLASRTFVEGLRLHGLGIEHVTEHKQTATVQRWKFGLQTPVIPSPVPTRIEFSRRKAGGETRFEPVSPALVGAYGLPPILVTHYTAPEAFRQKLEALGSRAVPQARDVFDLHLLLASGAVPAASAAGLDPAARERARERVYAMDFADFRGQVLAYLTSEDQAAWGGEPAWDGIRLRVLAALEGSAP
jgi:hypothetical protein